MKRAVYQGKDYEIIFELNDWAERAPVSLKVQSGGTLILVTALLGEEHPELDFVPLTVEYDERYYAVGKIFGSRFIRRETKPSNFAILNARLVDRALRSALPSNFRRSLQIINVVLSYDRKNDPSILALLGGSLALHMLGIDWKGPVGGVKVSYFGNNDFRFNLSDDEENQPLFSLTISNIGDKINMIEMEGKEIKEELLMEGFKVGLEEAKKVSQFLKENFVPENKILNTVPNLKPYEDIFQNFLSENNISLEKFLFTQEEGEKYYQEIFQLIEKSFEPSQIPYFMQVLRNELKKTFQKEVLTKKIRPDGRNLDEIRKLYAEVGILPKAHGSALFYRGLTHILSTVTLAPPGEELWIRQVEFEGFKYFMHHYNFPPYCTGEISPLKGPSRREIGHGALAEKALKYVLPSESSFPYIIRVVSDVLSSNGSTSMGSVSASSMALMDAGVPIEKHVAGISIGIAYEDDDHYELLTDIQGPEDFFGGMDFKVAGTKDGVTAIQLDVKIDGLTLKMIKETLEKARIAREKLIEFQESIIQKPREKLKEDVPKVGVINIEPEKIGLLIGPGGRTINEITLQTETKIEIKPDGTVYITGEKEENVERAKNWVKAVTTQLEVGDIVSGKVIKILPFGAILEIYPGRTALLHISEISDRKIEKIEDVVKIGMEYKVKIKEITPEGKISVSLKDAR